VTSLVSGGCVVSGAGVRESLLFTGVRCHSWSELTRAVALPYCEIGRHARLTDVVLDRGVTVPPGLVAGEDRAEDARWFRVSEGGVTLITQPMLDRRAAELGAGGA
jgi:glucose-1-phosphate adenylyltransferase